ncbi:MAG: FIST signal transduction protein [bacterium]
MRRSLVWFALAGAAVAAAGCALLPRMPWSKRPACARAGEPSEVAFAVGWCTDEDPAVAARSAVRRATEALGCPAKGLVFYEYFPRTVRDAEGEEKEVPDTERERLVLPALRAAAPSVPVIGCRARALVNGGTKLRDTVAVLAIGGQQVSCKTAKARLADDRKAVGQAIAKQLEGTRDLRLVLALSEMRLSFETKKGVSVEDFIRGVLARGGEDVVLLGGNCMPNDYQTDKGGVQFFDNQVLEGHVVAMGIGGPIAVYANHTNEFSPSTETVTVTKAEDKWVHELDGKPAAEVYRAIRGMKPDEPFTSDWQHPIGVIVAPGKVYLRMVLEEDEAKGALRFVAAVPEGTRVKILKGGADADAIVDSARQGIAELVHKAPDSQPLVALISDCCARGMRLRQFRQASECEIRQAVLPALRKHGPVPPVFGFYAWGELGPIAGPFHGLSCMYQQHTFVSALVCEEE